MRPIVESTAPLDVATAPTLPWIGVRPGLPYFVTDRGESWTPIGQNDAVSWPELAGLFRRRDLAAVERHLGWLVDHGVTCLRLMLEYAQGEHRYLERPAGRFVPNMVRLWDDLFAMLERAGLRVLLTPFDTYFTWVRWRHHPYNRAHGGPCVGRRKLLTCPATRAAVKARLRFASDRWGGSGALFAWDLWNEIHPAHGGDDPAAIHGFIADIADDLRRFEIARHGRAHPQTVSIFGPELVKHPVLNAAIFRHPALDFGNTHLYEHGTIDDPRDTVAPALTAARLIGDAVGQTEDLRPVFDSEHGPIHRFKDRHRTLPAAFDDEYFRHIQWAHLASGGAGGGMRWPNRSPHILTPGMRAAQRVLSEALPLIDWCHFRRRNLTAALSVSDDRIAAVGCGDRHQALLWLIRRDSVGRDGRLIADAEPAVVRIVVPGLDRGRYRVTAVNTVTGARVWNRTVLAGDGSDLAIDAVAIATDLALMIRRDGMYEPLSSNLR